MLGTGPQQWQSPREPHYCREALQARSRQKSRLVADRVASIDAYRKCRCVYINNAALEVLTLKKVDNAAGERSVMIGKFT